MAINSIQDLSFLLSTSVATYGTLDKYALTDSLSRAGSNANFTDKQAAEFANRYTLLDQLPNVPYNGFSAAVFLDKVTNRHVIAMRGTEIGIGGIDQIGQTVLDLCVTDIGKIGGAGFANNQAVEMYRYYKRLTTSGGLSVGYTEQEKWQLFAIKNTTAESWGPTEPSPALMSSQMNADYAAFKADLAQDKGVPVPAGSSSYSILSPTEQVDVTGHSLGGHLAMLFARLFPNNVNEAVTLNAPGFFSWGDAALTKMGFPAPNNARITRVEADGDAVSEIGTVWPGNTIRIAQESEKGAAASIIGNHSSVNGNDALSLMAVMAKLDPRFANNAPGLSVFIRQASNTGANTYERVLDAIRAFLLGPNQTPTPISSGSSDPGRKGFYNNLYGLMDLDPVTGLPREGSAFAALQGKLQFVPSSANASTAASDFGQFLSLYYLSPFALKPVDAPSAEKLIAVQGQLGADWAHDKALSADDRAAGKAIFSDKYLADRAAMLSFKLYYDSKDKAYDQLYASAGQGGIDNPAVSAIFYDATKNITIDTSGTGNEANDRLFYFGKADGDDTMGGANSDRIYGMAGDDILKGEGGNDWLEGGAGDDQLRGGTGADVLVGGADNDTAYGEDGNDSLYGGTGNDTLYGGADDDLLQGWDGSDFLDGEAGKDRLNGGSGIDFLFGGANNDALYGDGGDDSLTGGTGNDWLEGGDGDDVYAFNDGDGSDVITDSDGLGRISINGSVLPVGIGFAGDNAWVSADGKIRFQFAPDSVGSTKGTLTITYTGGKVTVKEYEKGSLGVSVQDNPSPDPVAGEGTALSDNISTTNPISAGDGNDFILSTGNNGNAVDGGDGNDFISVVTGAKRVKGGAGNDAIVGTFSLQPNVNGDTEWQQRFANWFWATSEFGVLKGPAGNGAVENTWEEHNPDDTFGRYLLLSPATFDEGGRVRDAFIQYAPYPITDAMWVDAEAGNDIVSGGQGDDTIFGGSGADSLGGNRGNDLLAGGVDDDEITGNWGLDTLQGQEGNDSLYGGSEADVLLGGDGNDALDGDDNFDGVNYQTHGDDLLDGGKGNDVLYGMGANDTLIGGDGSDTLYGSGGAGMPANVDGKDYLDGGAGNDLLNGGEDNDTLFGGSGDDTLSGDSGGNVLAGADYLDGGIGDDILVGGNGADSLWGGDGNDTIATDGDDVPVALQGDDLAHGDLGNDYIRGYAGNDQLYGDAGNDSIHGEAGNDAIDGGTEIDWIDGGEGNDSIFGGDGDDGIAGTTVRLGGNSGALKGGAGNDLIDGGSGSDGLEGDDGNDTLRGGADADQLVGGDGNDSLDGGSGDDLLAGGYGNDTYVYSDGTDVIIETAGVDTLILSGYSRDAIDIWQNGTSLYLAAGNGTGIVIQNGFAGAIDRFNFGFGTLSLPDLLTDASITSQANDMPGLGALDASQETPVVDADELGLRDFLRMSSNSFVLDGTDDADSLYGGGANDTIIGKDGDDLLTGASGNDLILGGAGTDTIEGELGNDSLGGGLGDDVLDGGEGNDLLQAGDGNDLLIGGAGNDVLDGGAGDDRYRISAGDGNDVINDVDGQNTLQLGADITPNKLKLHQTQSGTLLISLSDDQSLTVNGNVNALQFADGSVWDANEIRRRTTESTKTPWRQVGTAGTDSLTGSDKSDFIYALDGNDLLEGGADDDLLSGGSGADTLMGDAGSDALTGGSGNDLLQGGNDKDALEGNAGDDTLYGELGHDRLYGGSGNDLLDGGRSGDTLVGEAGDDTLLGGDGNDYLVDAAGSNLVLGGDGDDSIFGYGGEATVDGGMGNDSIAAEGARMSVAYSSDEGNDQIRIENSSTVSLLLKNATSLDDFNISFNKVHEGDGDYYGIVTDIALNFANGAHLTISNGGSDAEWYVNRITDIQLANGQRISFADMLHQKGMTEAPPRQGSEADYFLGGSAGDDTLTASVENIDARDGNDVVVFDRSGRFFVNGGAGDDTFVLDVLGIAEHTDNNWQQFAGQIRSTTGFFADLRDSSGKNHIELTNVEGVEDLKISLDRDYFTFSFDLRGERQEHRILVTGETIDSVKIGGESIDVNALLQMSQRGDPLTNPMPAATLGKTAWQEGMAYQYYVDDEGDYVVEFAEGIDPNQVDLERYNYQICALRQALDFWETNQDLLLTYDIRTLLQDNHGAATWQEVAMRQQMAFDHVFAKDGSKNEPDNSATPRRRLDKIIFANGEVWDRGAMQEQAMQNSSKSLHLGSSADDAIVGRDHTGMMIGGDGNDSFDVATNGFYDIRTGKGDDTVRFGYGKGKIRLDMYDTSGGGTDTISFNEDVRPEDVALSGGYRNLKIGLLDSPSMLEIEGIGYAPENPNHYRFQFTSTGETWEWNDILTRLYAGTEGNDTIIGFDGGLADISGRSGNDWLFASSTANRLSGGDGDDTLWGGMGGDILRGGDGNDVLTVSLQYQDTDGNDSLFGEGGNDSLSYGVGSDLVDGGDGNDSISGAFSLGSSETARIIGGKGNDSITGGLGSDTYVFALGDGQDTISESRSANAAQLDVLELGAGISASDLIVRSNGYDLSIRFQNSPSDNIRFSSWYNWNPSAPPVNPAQQIEIVRFVDGSELSAADLMALAQPNQSPTPTISAMTAYLQIGEAFSWTIPADLFSDPEGDDVSTEIGLMPSWMQYDAATTTFSGVARFEQNTNPAIGITAKDSFGNVGSFSFYLQVAEPGRVYEGTPYDDFLDATNGNDTIRGFAGDDWLIGYEGRDSIAGGAGQDSLLGGQGNDSLFGDDGHDLLKGEGNDDSLFGGVGDDTLEGGDGRDQLFGDVGSDSLVGGGGDDSLFGGDGNDTLEDFGGANQLQGGAGEDFLSTSGGNNTLYGGDGDDWLEELDGDSLLDGGDGSDSLNDTGGASTLIGGAGDDFLFGGGGNDLLDGGMGSDEYHFAYGDGADTISDQSSDEADVDVILFGEDISVTDLVAQRDGDHLRLLVGGEEDQILLQNYYTGSSAIDYLAFADGTELTLADFLANPPANHVPIANTVIDPLLIHEDQLFSYTIPEDAFIDEDVGDQLSLTLTAADGSPLPDWLTFDVASGTLSGVPTNADVGDLSLQLIATDNAGEQAVQTLQLNIQNVNDSPVVVSTIPALFATEEAGFTYSLPADAFADVDAGDLLSIQVVQQNGQPLPSWLAFDPQTLQLTGTPSNNDVGLLGLSAVATDRSGAHATQPFALQIVLRAGNTVNGGTANDTLRGGTGADVIHGGSGADLIQGNESSDQLFGDAGNDRVYGWTGNDSLYGGNDNDKLYGDDGNDLLYGELGADVLFGWAGNDTLDGGDGNDTLNGEDDNDRISGGTGKDVMFGGAGNDTLAGGAAIDWLEGGTGNDTYQFERGDGPDDIYDEDSTANNQDVIQFGTGIAADQLWFRQLNTVDLAIGIIGTTDQVTVKNWFSGSQYHTELIRSGDGKTLVDADVQKLVDAMAAFAPPAAGQTTLPSNYQSSLNPVLAANWH